MLVIVVGSIEPEQQGSSVRERVIPKTEGGQTPKRPGFGG